MQNTVKFKWNNALSDEFLKSQNRDDILAISEEIEALNLQSVNQEVIDALNKSIKDVYMFAGSQSGILKECYRNGKHKNSRKAEKKLWFNNECMKLRSEYLKLKKKYKISNSDFYERFQEAKKKYKKSINKAKVEFYADKHAKLTN